MSKTREIANKLIDGMNDVTITSPASGQALVYNGTAWVNNVGSGVGFKNYIINGNFDVWQRGTSQTLTGYGSVDRWFSDTRAGSSYTLTRRDTSTFYPTVNTKYFANIAFSPTNYANDSTERGMFLDQWLENGFRNLMGKTVTISILVDTNQDFAIGFGNIDSTNSQGGTAPGWRKIESKKFTAIPGVNKYTYTFTMPSTLTPGTSEYKDHLLMWISFGCNQYYADAGFGVGKITAFNTTGTYFNLLQVQLEEGSIATPFEQRPYGLELSLCQRYYEVKYNAGNIVNNNYGHSCFSAPSNNTYYGNWEFTVPKRIAPTVSAVGCVGANAFHKPAVFLSTVTTVSMVSVSETRCQVAVYTSDSHVSASGFMTAGYLTASAEL